MKKFTRRDFLKLSAVGLAASGAVVMAGRIIAIPPDLKLPDPYPELPEQVPTIPKQGSGARFFNEHQYTLVATLAALFIPTDEAPGATEANVVEYIDNMVSLSKKSQSQYTQGLKWIDRVSERKYGKDFLSLRVEEQIGLMRFADNAAALRRRPVANIVQRLDRKIESVWDDLTGVGEGSPFFHMLREDVFYGYYSNPVSWKVVGYYGPPQPVGYPDYSEPPSNAHYAGVVRAADDTTCRSCHYDQTKKASHRNRMECTGCHTSHFDPGGKG
ncbi:MAG: gluconate 2-dehydrogenase subunit 3 family protein [Nitrospirota bacterium]|nr:gluconate 2-dehydrogenase subunit 3 family protein [Nitrospirota bacterium]